MSNPSQLGSYAYESETVFGEDVTTFATARFTHKGVVDVSGLTQQKVDSGRNNQFANEGTDYLLGVMGGSFTIEFPLTGHGSSTAGATTLGLVETILGKIFGSVAVVSAATGTTAAAGGTASLFNTVASGTFLPGSLTPVGVLGDGRGNGQCVPVATHAGTVLTPLVAIDGAPNAGDVIGSAVNIYTLETSFAANSFRFLAQTWNLCYEMHGCYPTAAVFSGLNPAEFPTVKVTFAVSWWRYSTVTPPNATTTEAFNAAANAAGTLFVNDVGTATRVKRTCRNFSIAFKLGMTDLPGPGGVNAFQSNVGARRLPCDIRISWLEDADANTLTPVLPGFATGTTKKHVLYVLNPTSGSRVAFYFPQVRVTAVPLQMNDRNVNRLRFDGECNTGPTTTSDLLASAFRMAWS